MGVPTVCLLVFSAAACLCFALFAGKQLNAWLDGCRWLSIAELAETNSVCCECCCILGNAHGLGESLEEPSVF